MTREIQIGFFNCESKDKFEHHCANVIRCGGQILNTDYDEEGTEGFIILDPGDYPTFKAKWLQTDGSPVSTLSKLI